MLSSFRSRYENRAFVQLQAVYSVYVSIKRELPSGFCRISIDLVETSLVQLLADI